MSYESYIHKEDTCLIDRIEFSIFGNQEIKRYSVISDQYGINIPETYDNGEPKQGGLVDKRLGITDYSSLCDTCGLNTNDCPGHFGHMILADDVYHKGFLNILKDILNCICIQCSKLLITKTKDEIIEVLGNSIGKNRFMKIKKITSNIKFCQHFDGGCGKPVGKVMKNITKLGSIELQVSYSVDHKVDDKGEVSENINFKKKNIEILTSNRVYNILKNIDNNDWQLMGFDFKKNKPEDFIIKIFPIPPVAIRPSVKLEMLSGASENDLTSKLADIIKDNARLRKQKERTNIVTDKSKYNADYLSLLQYDIATYIENDAVLPKSEQKNSKISKSVSERLKGKTGRIRGNLMGKRVDFSARTVITSDPNLSLDELGVPIKIAMNITFPEIVTPFNLDKLSKLVRNGRDIYPGANFIIPLNSLETGKKLKIDLRYRKKSIKLHIGDIVERHIVDGDPVLFNRQPTLHKMGMMCHKIRVIKDENLNTFRINVIVTDPYNADFDGDEMNMFIPQTNQTQLELSNIADVKRQIIDPKTSLPIMKFKQDTTLGTYKMTYKSYIIDYHDVMNLLMYCNIDNLFDITKKNINSHELFSMIIPKMINYSNNNININNGKLTSGIINNYILNNIILYYSWDRYGPEITKKYIDNAQRLITNWLLMTGFTVGLGDAMTDKILLDDIKSFCYIKNMEVDKLITEMENNPDTLDSDTFETNLQATLKATDGIITKKVYEYIKLNNPENNFFVMIDSNAKGKKNNISQIIGGLGQNVLQFKRIPKKVNNRTMPHFFQNDDRGHARGFIQNSYYNGLNPSEFYFHHMTGREGLIDTAIKSVSGDTPIIIMEDDKILYINIGTWIDNLIQTNNHKVQYHIENDMELLELDYEAYIPTTDNYGNVSWGVIKNVTRHDPGKELYEIITSGGRKVIVTIAHSLLIWNYDINQFEQTSIKNVKLGDKVPVTAFLTTPPVIKNNINISEYLSKYISYNSYNNIIKEKKNNKIHKSILKIKSITNFEYKINKINNKHNDNIYNSFFINNNFELNEINGIFLGIFINCGNLNILTGTIKITINDIDIIEFIKLWFNKYNIKYKIYLNNISIIANCKVLTNFLYNLFGKRKFIPDECMNGSDDFIKGLLNGIFSSKGIFGIDNIILYSIYQRYINNINICLSRFGIFSRIINSNIKNILSIRSCWINIFRQKINLISSEKNILLKSLKPSNIHRNYKQINDVVLDTIIKINKVDIQKYPKVYDLTIPSTLNFGLANGLHVVDTADTGYLARKLIKGMEDIIFTYDKTVRTANNVIIQMIYGDNNINQIYYKEVDIILVKMSDSEIENKFCFSSKELDIIIKEHNLNTKEFTKWNKNLYKYMLSLRDELRDIQTKARLDYITMKDKYQLPINISRIIDDIKKNNNTNTSNLSPLYIMDSIKFILEPNITKVCMINKNYDINSFKYKDQARSKYLLGIALYEYLNPKRCLFEYKINKKQFDDIVLEIIKSYKKASVEPGEMVGVMTAQVMGESLTQMCLMGGISILLKKMNKETKLVSVITTTIGEFIDNLYIKYPENISNIPNHIDSTEYTLEHLDDEYYICGVNNDEKVNWNKISHLSKHPTNGSLLKIKTLSGRTITTTKSHNFLKRTKDDGIIAVTSKDLKLKDRIPVARKIKFCCNNQELTLLDYKLILTNNMGWFFGAYLAEGSINGNLINISNISPYYYNNIYSLKEHLNVNIRKREYQGEYGISLSTSFIHKQLANIITTYCKKGSFNKVVPEFVHNTNLDFVRGLLRGYFDGDGSLEESKAFFREALQDNKQSLLSCNGNVTKSRKIIRVGSRSKQLIEDITLLLTYFGIFGSNYTEKKKENDTPFYCIGIPHKYAKVFLEEIGSDFPEKIKDIEDIIEFSKNQLTYNSETIDRIPELGHIIKRIGNILQMPGNSRTYGVYERKNLNIGRTTLEIYLKRFEARAIELNMYDKVRLDLEYLKMIIDGEVIWDEIKEIIEIEDPKESVYDFTVPKNETFMVYNGIIVHNTLNSVAWNEKIMYIDDKNNCNVEEIGKFIDELLDNNENVLHLDNNTETEYLDISNKKLNIQSVDENGKMHWKAIEAITRHLPGGNMVKVKTLSGRTVVATKAKSFLVRRNNKLVAVEGSEIKINDYLPVQKKAPKLDKYLDYYKEHFLSYNYGYSLGLKLSKIEPWMLMANDQFIYGYLNGYFIDESIMRYNYIIVNEDSLTKNTLYGLNEMLNRFNKFISIKSINEIIPGINLSIDTINCISCICRKNNIIINIINNILCYIPYFKNYYINNIEETKLIGDYKKIDIENLYSSAIKNSNYNILKDTLFQDVYYDKIIDIIEMPLEYFTPTHNKVYDLTVADTRNFNLYGGLCMRDTFHQSGVGVQGMQGISRFREILSYTKKIHTPFMIIKLIPEVRDDINIAHKIKAHLKHTLLKDIIDKMDIIFDPEPDNLIKENEINTDSIYYLNNNNIDISNFVWLYKLKISREAMLENDITLLDIKIKFIKYWEEYTNDNSISKRKLIISRIYNGCILSNFDNSKEPTINIRLDILNPDNNTLVEIGQYILNKISIKGVQTIEKVNKCDKQKVIAYNSDNSIKSDAYEYVIYTTGIDIEKIKTIKYIDYYTMYLNDIYLVYINFGIEAARTHIMIEIDKVYNGGGIPINISHLGLLADIMTNTGSITSIDRHGINRLDTDPLSRVSFEQPIEQLMMASAFNEIDHMKSVSSRIMAGRCIKGGTGLCDVLMDNDMIENSESTINTPNFMKNKNIELETSNLINNIINNKTYIEQDIFIP
jgi:DNA-directed RNA polymerase beta' subunit